MSSEELAKARQRALEVAAQAEAGQSDPVVLREVIGLLEGSGDFRSAAGLKTRLARLVAQQQQVEQQKAGDLALKVYAARSRLRAAEASGDPAAVQEARAAIEKLVEAGR